MPCSWDLTACAGLVSGTAWAQLRGCNPDNVHPKFASAALCTLAAALQDLPLLQKLRLAPQACPFDAETLTVLVHCGAVQSLQWLHDSASQQELLELQACSLALAKAAAEASQLQTLAWLCEHYTPDFHTEQFPALDLCEMWADAISKAAIRGVDPRVLAWVWGKRPASLWQQDACPYAADKGSTAGLRWLLAQHPLCVWEPEFPHLQGALREQRFLLALSHYLHLPGPGLLDQIPMDAYACRQAAVRGNMELMRWLRDKGCPWDGRLCTISAGNGHLSMLQWLWSQSPPCKWTSHTTSSAAQHDHPDVLIWLLQQEQPACPPPSRPELASDRCLALLIQFHSPLTLAARARATALGALSPNLVMGLARWQRKQESLEPGPAAQQAAAQFIGDQRLLTQMARLLSGEVILHICALAGICKPMAASQTPAYAALLPSFLIAASSDAHSPVLSALD